MVWCTKSLQLTISNLLYSILGNSVIAQALFKHHVIIHSSIAHLYFMHLKVDMMNIIRAIHYQIQLNEKQGSLE